MLARSLCSSEQCALAMPGTRNGGLGGLAPPACADVANQDSTVDRLERRRR